MTKKSSVDKSEALRCINEISPSFCLAKWLQVTVDIVHGTTHSCHHPERHPIPFEELARSPHALHNTSFKKLQRKLMQEGKRPPECVYCWDMEDAGSRYSDRVVKSSDPWAFPFLKETAGLPWDSDVLPTYIEVMIDNRCNLSCAYCMADISTSIAAEMQDHGPYPVTDKGHRMPAFRVPPEPNPYVQAFWDWLPLVLPNLKILRVTGGEPLLSQRLDQLLEFLAHAPNPELTFVLNSHLSVSDEKLQRFADKIESLKKANAIGGFQLYTSLDAWGPSAEYIRHGMDYHRVLKNIEHLAARFPDADAVVMCTFNLFSLSTFHRLLEDLTQLKKVRQNVALDTAYLRNPEYLSPSLATSELKQKTLEATLPYLAEGSVFSAHEKRKLENALRWMEKDLTEEDLNRGRRDFLLFVTEYDRRKNKRFLITFPEYLNLYRECKIALLTGQ